MSTSQLPGATTGTRSDLINLLVEMSEGWRHLGKDMLAAAAREGAQELAAGRASVRVGHIDYVVTDR